MKKFKIEPESFFDVLGGTSRSQVAEMVLDKKQSTGGPDNKHKNSDQWLFVISGEGEAVVEGEKTIIKEKDLLLIEKGETHEVINTSDEPLRTLNIYAPPDY